MTHYARNAGFTLAEKTSINRRVIQRREDARPLFGREVDIPGRAVADQEAEHLVTDHGHARDD